VVAGSLVGVVNPFVRSRRIPTRWTSTAGVDKEEVKADLQNLLEYSVPIDEAKQSVRRKHGGGVVARRRRQIRSTWTRSPPTTTA